MVVLLVSSLHLLDQVSSGLLDGWVGSLGSGRDRGDRGSDASE